MFILFDNYRERGAREAPAGDDAAGRLHHGRSTVVISGLIISHSDDYSGISAYTYIQSVPERQRGWGGGRGGLDGGRRGYAKTRREYELGGL